MLSICQVRSRQVKLNMELIYYNLVNFILLVTLQIFFLQYPHNLSYLYKCTSTPENLQVKKMIRFFHVRAQIKLPKINFECTIFFTTYERYKFAISSKYRVLQLNAIIQVGLGVRSRPSALTPYKTWLGKKIETTPRICYI